MEEEREREEEGRKGEEGKREEGKREEGKREEGKREEGKEGEREEEREGGGTSTTFDLHHSHPTHHHPHPLPPHQSGVFLCCKVLIVQTSLQHFVFLILLITVQGMLQLETGL